MSQQFCPFCMTPIQTDTLCPACGKAPGSYQPAPHHLLPGTVLAGRFVLGRVLGEGGFGITYIGRDTRLNLKVAVKEYFPKALVSRNNAVSSMITSYTDGSDIFRHGLDSFLREAQAMAQMAKTPEIVTVRDFFQENGTAYIVMEYVEGTTLKDLVEQNGGPIPADQLFSLVQPLFRALHTLHSQGLIHRDISPDNLMLENGRVRLLDFGCARESASGAATMTVMLKQGFSPIEQYKQKGQGPWTDVYALAATIYYCITGVIPPQPLERLTEEDVIPPRQLGVAITEQQEKALLCGMGLQPVNRFHSIRAFYASLYEGAPIPVTPEQTAPQNTRTGPDASSMGPTVGPYRQPFQPQNVQPQDQRYRETQLRGDIPQPQSDQIDANQRMSSGGDQPRPAAPNGSQPNGSVRPTAPPAQNAGPGMGYTVQLNTPAATGSAPKQKSNTKKIIGIAAGLVAILVVLAIIIVPIAMKGSGGPTETPAASPTDSPAGTPTVSPTGSPTEAPTPTPAETDPPSTQAPIFQSYTAVIDIKDYGKITVALDSEAAPETVENFVSLARSGFYDGLTFHRIIEGFMMQGGDPNGDGTGGSDKTIKGEFSANDFANNLSHTRGAISMARSNDMDSASSQFFIVQQDSPHLDGQYACFGYVIDGMDVVDAICKAAEPIDNNGSIAPEDQPVILSITITEGGDGSRNIPPTISGVTDHTVMVGTEFDAMAGVTANDAEDGDITSKIVITSVPELTFSNGKTTPADPGDYELIYIVTDKNGGQGNAYATLTVTRQTTDPSALFNFDFTVPGNIDDHGWVAHVADGVAATGEHKQGAFVFDITDPGAGDGDIQLIKSGMEIKAADYKVKVWAKSTAPTYAHLLARNEQAEGWETFGGTYNARIGTEVAPIELNFTATAAGSAELILNLGKITPNPDNPADTTPSNFTVTIDKIEIYETIDYEHEAAVYRNDFSKKSSDALKLSTSGGASGSAVCNGDGKGVFRIDNYPSSGDFWSINADMTLGGNTIDAGTKYYYRFTIKAENDQTGELLVESLSQNDAARADFYNLNLIAGEEVTIFHSFTAGASVSDPVIRMSIGRSSDGVTSNTITVTNLEFGTMEGDLEIIKTIESFAAPYNGDTYRWGVYNGTDEDNDRGVGTIWTQDGVLSYRIDEGSTTDWHNKLYFGMNLPSDRYFTVEFTAKATKPVSCNLFLNPAGNWDPLIDTHIDITTQEQTFTFTTTNTLLIDMDFDLLFQFGSADLVSLGEVTVEFSRLTIL